VSETLSRYDVKRKEGKVWSIIRQIWLDETPEERVRQEYACVLMNEYGYLPEQMDEEKDVTGRGSGQARADFIIWRTVQDRVASKSPLIIVECKSDNVTISSEDYWQGERYARYTNARFFVTHNTRDTKFWRVIHESMPKTLEEIENIPHRDASDKEVEEIISRLKTFKENEFADLLHECHNVIRSMEKKDPAAAFDEIAKILFVKVWVERELKSKHRRENVFTTATLDEQFGDNPLNDLFQKTKHEYRADAIFAPDSQVNLKAATSREIVKLLERYNLSDTSEDIKGIAFERFLGTTFRGENGQFFTPRTIVEFMIRMSAPQEGEVICDPACGSGGFLIRAFETVRESILRSIDAQYQEYKTQIEQKDLPEGEKATLLRKKFDELQKQIDPTRKGSRLWTLANRCIYGVDANDRMARTSKMNMIMHGDGHGGVHHHDGFLNVNGIFEGRFDLILTNPPFGAEVKRTEIVSLEEVTVPSDLEVQYNEQYGESYADARKRATSLVGKPKLDTFDTPKRTAKSVKTELLFMERVLALLKPGGRAAIVLPEGIFNNPSLAYIREFFERRAYIRAVVSLPQGTFASAQADVKTSILFMEKFSEAAERQFAEAAHNAQAEVRTRHAEEFKLLDLLNDQMLLAKKSKEMPCHKSLKEEHDKKMSTLESICTAEIRHKTRELFSYPIFLYDAEKVGITATGDTDKNELYPNDSVPDGLEKTCLEIYHEFLQHPAEFVISDDAE